MGIGKSWSIIDSKYSQKQAYGIELNPDIETALSKFSNTKNKALLLE